LAIHGGHSQEKRTKTMKFFSSNEKQILVCTDVAARGLDIKGVSHIYNYDLPRDGDSYIHRIGRTARAGAEGVALSLVSDRDYESFSKILRDTHLKIQNLELPVFNKIFVQFNQKQKDFRRSGNFRTEGRKDFGRRENQVRGHGSSGSFRSGERRDFSHGRNLQRNEQRGRRSPDRNEQGRRSHERGREGYNQRFSGSRNQVFSRNRNRGR